MILRTSAALLAAALWAGAASAQTMVKCQDKNGRTVYVDRDCAVYGLRSVGTVQDRVTTVAPANPPGTDERAPSPAGPQDGLPACRADAQKFCRGMRPGGDAMMNCLIDHQDDISDECYDVLKAKLGSASAPQPRADDPGEIRKRAIALCKQGRGIDCESEQGLREWINKETPLTEEERQEAVSGRRLRELCDKTNGAGSDECANLQPGR